MSSEYREITCSLLEAVRTGDLPRVAKLVDTYGLSHSADWSNGSAFLLEALRRKHVEVARFFITKDADVNSMDSYNKSALHYAVEYGDIKTVEMLLDHGAIINFTNEQHLLYNAIKHNEIYICKLLLTRLLNNGANLHIVDNDGASILHRVIEQNNVPMPLWATDVTCVTDQMWLSRCIRYEKTNKKIVQLLKLFLKFGIDINSTTISGKTPLHIATSLKNHDIVRDLILHGANINSADEMGQRALHLAARQDDCEIVDLLLLHGADTNSTDELGQIPLHLAARWSSEHVVAMLTTNSDINALTKQGLTPLDCYACSKINYPYTNICEIKEDDFDLVFNSLINTELINQAFKMFIANFYLHENNLRFIKKYINMGYFSFMVKIYEEEIKKMKNEKIKDTNISYYSVLTKGWTGVYNNNEHVVQAVRNLNPTALFFPNYHFLLQAEFRKGKQRQTLLKSGYSIFCSLLTSHMLPYDCIVKILNYLSIKELKTFVED